MDDRHYKSREDLLDAALSAWTAAYWRRHGVSGCTALGAELPDAEGLRATIIAPWRDRKATSRLVTSPIS